MEGWDGGWEALPKRALERDLKDHLIGSPKHWQGAGQMFGPCHVHGLSGEFSQACMEVKHF